MVDLNSHQLRLPRAFDDDTGTWVDEAITRLPSKEREKMLEALHKAAGEVFRPVDSVFDSVPRAESSCL